MIRLLRQEFTSVCSFIEEKRRCFYASIYYSNGWYSKVTFKYNFISEFIDFYRIINPFAKIWYNSRKKTPERIPWLFYKTIYPNLIWTASWPLSLTNCCPSSYSILFFWLPRNWFFCLSRNSWLHLSSWPDRTRVGRRPLPVWWKIFSIMPSTLS